MQDGATKVGELAVRRYSESRSCWQQGVCPDGRVPVCVRRRKGGKDRRRLAVISKDSGRLSWRARRRSRAIELTILSYGENGGEDAQRG